MIPELGTSTEVASVAFVQVIILVIIVVTVRDMIWKGIALWKSGNRKQLARFVCMFIFNTAGILPIIYLAFFQKNEKKEILKTIPKEEKIVKKKHVGYSKAN